jgi:hypothetical protein
MRPSAQQHRVANALPVYLIILVALQIFLITVAVESFATDHESLAWATATVSVVLAVSAALLLRYLRR